MSKEIIQSEEFHYKCDKCGEYSEEGVITIQFNYGSKLDGQDLSFCSDKCFEALCIMNDPKSELCECGHARKEHNKNGCDYLNHGVQLKVCQCRKFQLLEQDAPDSTGQHKTAPSDEEQIKKEIDKDY